MVTYKKKHSPVGFYYIQWNPSIADIMGPPLHVWVIEIMFDFWLGLQHIHCVGLCSIKFVTDKKMFKFLLNSPSRHQYQPPTTQTTPKKTSTLERAANLVREKTTSFKRRTESSSNLLESSEESGDYDEVLVNPAARGGDHKKVVVQLKSPHKNSRWVCCMGGRNCT